MSRRRVSVPRRGLLSRLVGWLWRHPYWAVWLAGAAVLFAEKGW